MQKYKAYKEYKASGIKWLGNIPKCWRKNLLKRLVSFCSRGNSPSYVEESSLKVINQACIYWDGLHLDKIKYNDDKVDFQNMKGKLVKGDLLINSTGTGTLGRVALFKQNGNYIADSHVTIIRTKQNLLDHRFLLYLFQTPIYQGYIYSVLVSGATNQIELSREGLRDTPVLLPLIEEQQKIAAFLDRETSKLDLLVEKKERLIELLKEKRQAIITQAVTKGLDPNVPMKDSGVEWLGEIPQHWKVNKLKFLKKDQLLYGANEPANIEDKDNPRYIRIIDVKLDGTLYENTFKSLPMEIAKPYLLKDGDILFARSGATVGKSFMYKKEWGPACFAGYLIRFRPDIKKVLPDFINYITQSIIYKRFIELSTIQATIQNVSAERYSNLIIGLPNLEEQKKICSFLDNNTQIINVLINKLTQQITKIKEYRQALISAAVTGKIDVRDEV